MPTLLLDSFLGYKPDAANPPSGSARAGQNFIIHRHRDLEGKNKGWIELGQGYAKKFSNGLPSNDTVRKITNIVHENIYNLYIPDNGGQNVTVVTATYRKTGYFPGSPTLDRFGVWVRPYWNGSSWVDAWRELTEMMIFEIVSLGIGANNRKIYIDNGVTYNFPTVDPGATVFSSDYFKNWTIVYSGFGNAENYDLIAGSGYDGSSYYLELLPNHTNTQFGTRTVGTKLLVYRGFMMRELPSALASHIYGLLSEARISSGNSASDVLLMVAYRSASFIVGGANPYTRTVNELVCDSALLDSWQYAAVAGIVGAYAATGSEVVPAGTYDFKYSLVTDQGEETRLYDALDVEGSGIWGPDPATVTVATDEKIRVIVSRSWGALPRRARYLRLYMSNNNSEFYRVKDYDLRDATFWTDSVQRGFSVFGGNHWYADRGTNYPSEAIYITGVDWSNAGPEASAQIGRGITDSGLLTATSVAVVGRRAYAVGVRVNGTLYPNIAYVSTQSGDGTAQFDVFPLMSTLNIDLEYNDGDELLAVHPASDRVLFLKRRSVVLVTPGTAAFFRELVTKADGIVNAKTLADFEDRVYWAGYNGIYRYTTRGWDLINEDWLQEWRELASATKEAAVAAIDRVNRQYRIAYGGIERLYDIDTGEWSIADLANQPGRFAANHRDGSVDFLQGSQIYTLGGGTRHDGTNFSMEYEFNDFPLGRNVGENVLVIGAKLRYKSDIPITVQLYKDGSASGIATQVLAAGETEAKLLVPLSFRAKRLHLKLTANTSGVSQATKIKEFGLLYEPIPAGVSISV